MKRRKQIVKFRELSADRISVTSLRRRFALYACARTTRIGASQFENYIRKTETKEFRFFWFYNLYKILAKVYDC